MATTYNEIYNLVHNALKTNGMTVLRRYDVGKSQIKQYAQINNTKGIIMYHFVPDEQEPKGYSFVFNLSFGYLRTKRDSYDYNNVVVCYVPICPFRNDSHQEQLIKLIQQNLGNEVVDKSDLTKVQALLNNQLLTGYQY